MAENNGVPEHQQQQQQQQHPNPFVSLLQNFRLPFPLPGGDRQASDSKDAAEKPAGRAGSDDKVGAVKFGEPRPVVPPSLKLESTEESAQSAAVVWQVYALGGYLLARWIWGKWKERHAKDDEPSDENTYPPDN